MKDLRVLSVLLFVALTSAVPSDGGCKYILGKCFVSTRSPPETTTLSQIKSGSLVENNTLDQNATEIKRWFFKDNGPDEKADKKHLNYGHIDDKQALFAPRFKHPKKLYKMEVKPAGNSIRVKCAAEGNPTPNITWYKNKNTPISRAYFQPSYGKWSMSLDELTGADSGDYTCVVCNELGCINHTMALLVEERIYAKPVVTRGADNVTVVVGHTAQFSCQFFTELHPSIFWLYSSRDDYIYNNTVDPMGQSTKSRIVSSQNPDDKAEQLTLYNVTKEDEGCYICVALNSLGNATAKGFLKVLV